jgi:ArsR family transcriptional regulator
MSKWIDCRARSLLEPMSQGQAADLAGVFKALGDPVRLRLLSLIASGPGGEVCVCELIDAFDLTGPTISHHLKKLRAAGIIDGTRRGTWIYYRVLPDRLALLGDVLASAGQVRA